MRNKLRIAATLLAALCLVLVVVYAFTDKSGIFAESSSGKETVVKKKVYVIMKSTTSAFWKSVESGVNAASTEYNLDYVFEGPSSEEDYEGQNKMVEEAVHDGANAIVFSAVDFEGNKQAIDEAAKQGVKIVVIDSAVNSEAAACYIGTNNYEAGCKAGEAALSCDYETLNVGIVNFDENSENGQKREQGCRDILAKDGRTMIVDSINVRSTIEDAKKGTIEMIERRPDINVIVTLNEWTSLGVGYAIQELGLSEKIHVVAFDSNVVSIGMLETGEVDALIVQSPYAMGYLGIECAYMLLNGQSLPEKEIDTKLLIVTKKNMYTEECQRLLFAFDK